MAQDKLDQGVVTSLDSKDSFVEVETMQDKIKSDKLDVGLMLQMLMHKFEEIKDTLNENYLHLNQKFDSLIKNNLKLNQKINTQENKEINQIENDTVSLVGETNGKLAVANDMVVDTDIQVEQNSRMEAEIVNRPNCNNKVVEVSVKSNKNVIVRDSGGVEGDQIGKDFVDGLGKVGYTRNANKTINKVVEVMLEENIGEVGLKNVNTLKFH